MDPSSQFIVPTIIDVPELIVTNEDIDYDETSGSSVWLNKLQFLASSLNFVINLANIWRFPYLCYKHGGGSFLITYTILLITLGLPLFLMELAFGQYANEGPVTIWRISPVFEGIGYAMCLISAMVALYYCIINSWIIHYLFASMTFSDLPWSRCDNNWNSLQCFLKPDQPTISSINCTSTSNTLNTTMTSDQQNSILLAGNCSQVNSYEFERIINSTDNVNLPANEYFHNNLLALSNSITELGSLNWDTLIGLLIAWSTVLVIMIKDLRFSGRLAVATLIIPYIALAAILIKALTLTGATDGISYYFTIQWSRLQNIDIWADSTTQLFFSLSSCWGGVITLASMNKFHNNFHTDAMLIVAINYATSLFSGLITFAIVGYMSSYSGIAINEVVDTGLGFIFMVYTEVLSKLPLASLNSIIFFSIMLFIGISSQLTVIETVITTIVDTWPNKLRYRKPLILMILCASMSFLSLFVCFGNGFYIVQLLDSFAGSFSAMIVGILELIAIAWVYGIENFMQDIDDMISVHRNLFPSRTFWSFNWRYLTPSIMFAILLFSITDLPPLSYRGVIQPEWTLKCGWVSTIVCVLVIPVMACIRLLLSPRGSLLDKISYLCRPSEDWAPSSYISGPKLINRHMDNRNFEASRALYSNPQAARPYDDHDQESMESNEDLKVVDGRANYIIPEEEDDTDTGLITNETNV